MGGYEYLFFEEIAKRFARLVRCRVRVPGNAGFREDKEIAEVGLRLFFYQLGHGFPALLRSGPVIKFAVETAVQVRAAELTLIFSADALLDRQLSLACVADFHGRYDIVILFWKQGKNLGSFVFLVETTLLPHMERQKRNPEEKPFSRRDAKKGESV
jgi:hypothetical protein